MFEKLIALINEYAHNGFADANEKLNCFISTTDNFIDILAQIGTIPESIAHDSTEEKIFAKASDAVLSRAFRELGLKSTVLDERSDSADVIAESLLYGYTLVADAKAFRLSRTAKNQKDFKVVALSSWRKDSNYAVLCSPYYQYPRKTSQIYKQSIDHNVCLLSWEHLIFALSAGIKESEKINLSCLWNFGESISHKVLAADMKRYFLSDFDTTFSEAIGRSKVDFEKALGKCISILQHRGEIEKSYLEEERKQISMYSREQAIDELIKSKKIDEKIHQITQYIRGISRA
ncbi:MAG: HindIII family type II restriction endonuclease [Oscillospiraceae bacterium]|jgi:type II restriction enzyme|nr:HindIII family type II restriction endonuclease [Oscillospiraceae bacterium]